MKKIRTIVVCALLVTSCTAQKPTPPEALPPAANERVVTLEERILSERDTLLVLIFDNSPHKRLSVDNEWDPQSLRINLRHFVTRFGTEGLRLVLPYPLKDVPTSLQERLTEISEMLQEEGVNPKHLAVKRSLKLRGSACGPGGKCEPDRWVLCATVWAECQYEAPVS